jgi:hypothetical protein
MFKKSKKIPRLSVAGGTRGVDLTRTFDSVKGMGAGRYFNISPSRTAGAGGEDLLRRSLLSRRI